MDPTALASALHVSSEEHLKLLIKVHLPKIESNPAAQSNTAQLAIIVNVANQRDVEEGCLALVSSHNNELLSSSLLAISSDLTISTTQIPSSTTSTSPDALTTSSLIVTFSNAVNAISCIISSNADALQDVLHEVRRLLAIARLLPVSLPSHRLLI